MSGQIKFDENNTNDEEFTNVVRDAAKALHKRYWDIKFDELGGITLNKYLQQLAYSVSQSILQELFVKVWDTCSNDDTKAEIAKHVGADNKKAISVSCAGLNTVVIIPATQTLVEQLVGDISYALFGALRNANNAGSDEELYATVKEIMNRAIEEGLKKGRGDIDAANAVVQRMAKQYS